MLKEKKGRRGKLRVQTKKTIGRINRDEKEIVGLILTHVQQVNLIAFECLKGKNKETLWILFEFIVLCCLYSFGPVNKSFLIVFMIVMSSSKVNRYHVYEYWWKINDYFFWGGGRGGH